VTDFLQGPYPSAHAESHPPRPHHADSTRSKPRFNGETQVEEAHRYRVLVSSGPLPPCRRRINYDYISAALRPLSQGSRVLRNSFQSFRRPSTWRCHAFGFAPRQPERCLAGNQHLISVRLLSVVRLATILATMDVF